jgi:hypothetical protein
MREVLAVPAGFDARRHAVALVPTSAGAQSNSAADLGLARQREGVEPEDWPRGGCGPGSENTFLGNEDSHLYCGPREKTVLLGCTCGEPGCWPLMARVEVSPLEVRWDEFEQPHRRGRWSHATLGPFVFDRRPYEATLTQAETSTPPEPWRTDAEPP